MKIKKKTIVLVSIFLLHLVFGILYNFVDETPFESRFEIIFLWLNVILFFIWVEFDSNDYEFYISRLLKVLIIMLGIPFFWYIFKTRKLKGFLFILKFIGFIMLLFLSQATGYLPIALLRGTL